MFGLFEGRRPRPPEAAKPARPVLSEARTNSPRPRVIDIDTTKDIPLDVVRPELDLRERRMPKGRPPETPRDVII